jgi:hypothetical protein
MDIQNAFDHVKKNGVHVEEPVIDISGMANIKNERWTMEIKGLTVMAASMTWDQYVGPGKSEPATVLGLHVLNDKGTVFLAKIRYSEQQTWREWFEAAGDFKGVAHLFTESR